MLWKNLSLLEDSALCKFYCQRRSDQNYNLVDYISQKPQAAGIKVPFLVSVDNSSTFKIVN